MGIELIVLIASLLVAGAIIVFGVFGQRREQAIVEQRLGTLANAGARYEPLITGDDESESGDRKRESSPILARLNKSLSDRAFGKKWRLQLARADLKLTVAEFLLLHFVSMVGFFAAAWFVVFRADIVPSIIAAFVGFFFPRIIVSRKISKRLVTFEQQLPDTLGLWVNALRSGYSVPQAMEAIGRDAPEPTQSEFRRVVQELQLGITMQEGMNHMLERVESDDLDLVITAVNIAREVGGNLSEILEVISNTIRERIKLKGEIRVLTSQGRATGFLISFLPIALGFLLRAINPGYMDQMFENRLCGWPMLGVGMAMMGIATALIQKIMDIEI
jgi:tight adherence protein B